MAYPYIVFDDLTALATEGGYNLHPRMSQLSSVFLLSACLVMRQKYLWQEAIKPIDQATWQAINDMIDQAESDLMISYGIGSIFASISDLDSNLDLLRLDGSTVLQADYPMLTAVVPASWLVGSDIQLPNLDESGLHGGYAGIGQTIGENNVTLTEAQMPIHTHIQDAHAHSEVIPIVTPTLGGEIPATASLVTPSPSTTGFTVATNNTAGGDEAHNNIAQSLTVIWYLVAQ